MQEMDLTAYNWNDASTIVTITGNTGCIAKDTATITDGFNY